jgi:hypothetical protein
MVQRSNGMGVVQTLNEPRKLGVGVAAAVVLVGIGMLGYRLFGVRETINAAAHTSAFYTDDDGKSFFTDNSNKMVPFDHDGKQAYRADVFQGADGKQFVGLIYRHTDSGRQAIESYFAKNSKGSDGLDRQIMERGRMQVRRAGAAEKTWLLNDEVTTERLQSSIVDSSGRPAKLVVPR